MNRVVRLGDLLVRQGVLAIVLLLPCLIIRPAARNAGSERTGCPVPQGPDSLGNITSGMTPGKGTQETPGRRAQTPPKCRMPRRTSRWRGPGATNATRNSRTGTTAKRPGDFPYHGQLRRCAGHRAGQETSAGGGVDLARFSSLRKQRTPAYRSFQRRPGAALRCPGDRPEPAPGHHEESER